MKDTRIRIFVSSPADVEHERAIVKEILERLAREFLPYFRVEPVLWEEEALTADRTFQAGMVRPSDCDIVLVVLWTRLGSPLPQDPYKGRTGTEWEFFDAVEASAADGRPEVLVYKKTNPKLVDITNPQQTLQALEERKRLEEFFQHNFFNEDQTFRRAFRTFDNDATFRNLVEVQLRKLLNRRIFVERRGPGLAFEWSGSPFRPDVPFGFGDERVFTGRENETRELMARLQEQAQGGEGFLLISGPSGSGKTSLLRAGVLPRLVRPHQITGVAACRWCVVDLAGAHGPIEAMARALCSADALGDRLAETGLDAEVLRRGLAADPELSVLQIDAALAGLTRAYRDDTGEPNASVRLAVVVDPLESLLDADGEQAAFVTALDALTRSGAVWVIALIRSDRLPDLGRAGVLGDLVGDRNWFRLEPIPAARSRQVAEIPALVAGLRFGADTRDRLPELLEAETVGLRLWPPLLEGTLARLFRRQLNAGAGGRGPGAVVDLHPDAAQRGQVPVEATSAGLASLGGLAGDALRRAEGIWAGCDEQVREALPRLCRALVGLESRSGARPAMRTADLTVLESEPASAELARLLIDARVLVAEGRRDAVLLTPCGAADDSPWGWFGRAVRETRAGRRGDLSAQNGGDGGESNPPVGAPGGDEETGPPAWREYRRTVTLAHPGVIDSWPPVVEWLRRRENREALVQRGEISRQARLWKRTDCNREYLLGESGFAAARRFAAAYPDELEPAEQELIARSDRYLRARRRSERLVRATGLVLVSLLVLVTLSALWAWDASRTATVNLHRSLLKESDLAITRGNTPEAVVLSLAAAPYLPREAANRLSRAMTGSHLVALAHEGPPLAGLPLSAAMDGRGERLVTADPSVGLRSWRLDGLAFAPEHAALGAELGIHLVVFAGGGTDGTFLGVSPQGVWRLPPADRDGPDYPCGAEPGAMYALAPDGRRLALSHALSPDRDAVCLMDLSRPGAVAFDLTPHDGEIRSLDFSQDGERLLTAGRDGRIQVLDAADGGILLRLPAEGPLRRVINRAVFDPQGERIAVAASDHRLRIYGMDGTLRRQLGEVEEAGAPRRVHDSEIRDIVFAPAGDLLVAADDDGQVVRWDLKEESSALVLGHHDDSVDLLRMAPAGGRVLTASRDGTARLWELATGRQLMVFSHDGAVSDASFTADGRRVLTESADDGTARLWDVSPVPRLARLLPHGDHVRHVAFFGSSGASSLRLATASSSGLVRIWELRTDGQIADSEEPLILSGHTAGVRHLDFSAEGSRLATASNDGTARLWDLSAGDLPDRTICRLMVTGDTSTRVEQALLDPSPWPRWLATVTDRQDTPLRIWGAEDCEPIRSDAIDAVAGAGAGAAAVRRLADGVLLAVGTDDGRLRVLFAGDDGSWRTQCDLRQHTRAVLDLDICPEGRLVATASEDRWARVLSVDSCSGEAASVDLVGHGDAVRSVRFSADGQSLVTGSLDGTARVWTSAGDEIAVLRDHSNRVYHAEFGGGDRFVLTASRDGAVRVWEKPARDAGPRPAPLLVYSAELGGVPHAAFSPDGRFIAAGYWRDAAALWRLLESGMPPATAGRSQRRAVWGEALYELAIAAEAERFRAENRLDALLDVPSGDE
jgi:WD40 repeat protein